MKTQNKKSLSVHKHSIVELNNSQLKTVVGGTGTFYDSSIQCEITNPMTNSSYPCYDAIFTNNIK